MSCWNRLGKSEKLNACLQHTVQHNTDCTANFAELFQKLSQHSMTLSSLVWCRCNWLQIIEHPVSREASIWNRTRTKDAQWFCKTNHHFQKQRNPSRASHIAQANFSWNGTFSARSPIYFGILMATQTTFMEVQPKVVGFWAASHLYNCKTNKTITKIIFLWMVFHIFQAADYTFTVGV